MTTPSTNLVFIQDGKVEVHRHEDDDGKKVFALLVAGVEHIEAQRKKAQGWRSATALDDVVAAVCVDRDRKELVLGGDFGFIEREDDFPVYCDRSFLLRELKPYWPGWTLRHAMAYPVELLSAHAREHGLALASNKALERELLDPLTREPAESLGEMVMTTHGSDDAAPLGPPTHLTEQHREMLLTRIEQVGLSVRAEKECENAGMVFLGDVLGATAARLDHAGLGMKTRAQLFEAIREVLQLAVPTTLPEFLDTALQEAQGWTLPIPLPAGWNTWREQALAGT
ncbi:hypothetical protein LZ198_28200 [Myxococcus sp. K15C18031901]|uniref:hypothetical protein n=1 Tax=Myxococcus dinghuensis TaxID=2906761 RepID=UPI0020A71102|nr:hypothetical protein [Myxococcus dinghuensis]MCP3102765.1 hypothetical protein [Myxococcus dinghuensis]